MEDRHLEDAFEFFCEGLTPCGPYWDHLLGIGEQVWNHQIGYCFSSMKI